MIEILSSYEVNRQIGEGRPDFSGATICGEVKVPKGVSHLNFAGCSFVPQAQNAEFTNCRFFEPDEG